MSRVHEVERVDWFIFQNNTCQSKSVLLGGVGGWGAADWSCGSLDFTTVTQRLSVCAPKTNRSTAIYKMSLLIVIGRRAKSEKLEIGWSFHMQGY